MKRANPLTYAIVAASCILAVLVVLGVGLRYAEAARQKLVRERTERSAFIMGCVEYQQINTCRVLHRMTQERQGKDDLRLSSFSDVAVATLGNGPGQESHQ